MSSKLRLAGKGNKTNTGLSEREQVELAIALSLQQNNQCIGHVPEAIARAPAHPAGAAACDEGTADDAGPRGKRAAAKRKTYVDEGSDADVQSDGDDDDDVVEPSDSGSDPEDDDSDFCDEDSEDERPKKKQKPKAGDVKKGVTKPSAAATKAGGAGKKTTGPKAAAPKKAASASKPATIKKGATATAVEATTRAAGSSKPGQVASGPSERQAGCAAAAAPKAASAPHVAPVPGPRASPEYPPAKAPLAASVPKAAAGLPVDPPHEEHGQEDADGPGTAGDEDAEEVGAGKSGVGEVDACEGEERSGHAGFSVSAAGTSSCGARLLPAAKPTGKPAAKPAAVPAGSGLHRQPPKPPIGSGAASAAAKAPGSVPKPPPKPLGLTNRSSVGTPASAPFKSPLTTSGGVSAGGSGIKLPTPSSGAPAYRVPGLRRPGAKKPA